MSKSASLLALLVFGCGGGEDRYLELHKGAKWTYVVSMDGDEVIQEITVRGRAPVGEYSGWLVDSAMGQSRLAWDGGTLYAAELAGTTYSPPIPLFANKPTTWSGVVSTSKSSTKGSADLSRKNENLVQGGKTYATAKTTLTLKTGKDTVELTTWFYQDLGILRQEQRSGAGMLRNRRIDFISGP